MATIEEELFAQRGERIAALATRARDMSESIHELQEQVRRDLPEAEARGVLVGFGADGVLASVEIDESLKLTEAELEKSFSLAVASAPLPKAVLSLLIADPARMRELREPGTESLGQFSGEGGIVTLVTRTGRPVRITLGRDALVRMSYADVAAEVVRLARLAAEEGANA